MPVKVTLLCDEWLSSKGGISTINRKLGIQLSEFSDLKVRLFMPKCDEKEKELVKKHKIKVYEAQPGYDSEKWWKSPPSKFKRTDFIIGHSAVLGKAAPDLRNRFNCKWIQVVHTDPEELGNFKDYSGAGAAGEDKREKEIKLCKKADFVVGIGLKLVEYISSSLRPKKVFCLTPDIFDEFSENVEQDPSVEEKKFRVLTFGRADPEDFPVKGYDIAVKAIAHLADKSYSLMFVGASDENRDKFRKRLVNLGISENQLMVRRFKTSQDDLAQIFGEVDLVIMPSRSEGFGLSALEGLSAGLPILVSWNSGLGEALRELPNGSSCVVDPDASANDADVVKEWAREIKKVREKPRQVRLEEAKRLREEYKKHYSWPKQCEDLKKKMLALLLGHSETVDRDVSPAAEEESPPVHPKPTKRRKVHPPEGTATKRKVESPIGGDDDDSNDDVDSGAVAKTLQIKTGVPSDDELQRLALDLESWRPLGRVLGFSEAQLTGFDEDNNKFSEKAYKMLLRWTSRDGSGATYQVLYRALCQDTVQQTRLAEKHCCR